MELPIPFRVKGGDAKQPGEPTSLTAADAWHLPSALFERSPMDAAISDEGGFLPGATLPKLSITLRINGRERQLAIEAWVTLLDLLREQEHLTGTKKGCDHGQCGACTVLIDGKRINACLKLAVSLDGAEITTIEGMATGTTLSPLQAAFVERDAFQCGYCTPGQICSAQGLLNEGRAKTRADVRELMSGNLCRCGAYPNILDAVMDVLEQGETK